MTRTLLALDLGTTTGWALRTPDRRIVSGTQSFKPQRFEGGGMRFLRFVRWLDELQALSGGLQHLAFEEVRRHASTDDAILAGQVVTFDAAGLGIGFGFDQAIVDAMQQRVDLVL